MEVVGDDFEAIVVFLDAELGRWEVSVYGEGGGSVFEFVVGRPLVAEEAVAEDGD